MICLIFFRLSKLLPTVKNMSSKAKMYDYKMELPTKGVSCGYDRKARTLPYYLYLLLAKQSDCFNSC